MISVIVPTFDEPRLLVALQSIRWQTWTDWECVVVDDGSRRAVADQVESLGDERFRVITHARNRGRGAARRTALEHARGDVIALHDADDWSLPDRFAAQMARLAAEPGLAFLDTAAYLAFPDGSIRLLRGDDQGARLLQPLEDPPVTHPALMFRRAVLEEVRYRSLRNAEDYDFLSRALRRFPFGRVGAAQYVKDAMRDHSLRKYLRLQRARSAILWELDRSRPLGWARRAAGNVVRAGAYTAAHLVGAEEALVRRQAAPATAADEARYRAARRELERAVGGIPGEGS